MVQDCDKPARPRCAFISLLPSLLLLLLLARHGTREGHGLCADAGAAAAGDDAPGRASRVAPPCLDDGGAATSAQCKKLSEVLVSVTFEV